MAGGRTDESGPTDRFLRRFDLVAYLYLGVVLVATVYFVRTFGFLRGGALVLCGHVLVHAPIFELRSEETMWTEKAVDAVRDEFASARNPLTSLWIAKADRIDRSEGEHEVAIQFTISDLFGLFSNRYAIDVDPASDDGRRLTIRRNDSVVVDTFIDVTSADDGTYLRLETERTAVHAFGLLLLVVLRSDVARHLSASGYELVDERTAVRPRIPGTTRPFAR